MARKKSPAQLRDEAKQLLKQAEAEENIRLQQIGEMVVKLVKKDFKDFDLERFKQDVVKIWEK